MGHSILMLKEAGTRLPAEGVLAQFAKIHAIRSLADLKNLGKGSAEIVLVDAAMPNLRSSDIVRRLTEAVPHNSVILLLDATQSPAQVLRQLASLRGLRPPSPPKRGVASMARLLGVSQESFARILNVSSRTAHRWLKGARPRPRAELNRLESIVSRLEETLPGTEAIRSYLNHPNPNLAGERPVDLLARRDFDRVESDLRAIQEGVYL